LRLLDAYGRLEEPRQRYLVAADKVRGLRRRFGTLTAERQQRQRELALVRFEREELDQAALEPGEVPELQQERERLANAQDLQAFAARGYADLYEEEGSVVERLGKVQRDAESWSRLDAELEEVVRRLEGLQSEVRDVAETLRRLDQRWEADPERLDVVER